MFVQQVVSKFLFGERFTCCRVEFSVRVIMENLKFCRLKRKKSEKPVA